MDELAHRPAKPMYVTLDRHAMALLDKMDVGPRGRSSILSEGVRLLARDRTDLLEKIERLASDTKRLEGQP